MGPVVDEQGLKKVLRYVSLSRQEGTILFQGHTDLGGQYVPPLMVSDLRPDSPVLHEEIFGPVLAVARVDNLDEAIRMANSTAQALTGGIFSRSPANIEKAQRELRAGNLYINRKITGALVGRQPFGGVGMSGVGHKAGGPDYLQQFMNGKSVSENTLRRGFAPDE
jgi:RHH-type proline utilization regulon transcriptional repressor/proline dehydrogenase/delta 1-pyrroline-5-carboxylate dehydrogenase